MIEFPESHKYLAGDYMRENPMYSAREVRELIAAEREACAKVCETEAAFAGSNGKKDASALNCADAIRMRSNNQGETDVFVLMRRYGESYWAASSTHETAKQAEDAARSTPLEGTDTWSIVKVCRLPVVVPSGEA